MPNWTYDDRNLLDAETSLWNAWKLLERPEAGAWTDRMRKLRDELALLAKEIQTYNEQWEE